MASRGPPRRRRVAQRDKVFSKSACLLGGLALFGCYRGAGPAGAGLRRAAAAAVNRENPATAFAEAFSERRRLDEDGGAKEKDFMCRSVYRAVQPNNNRVDGKSSGKKKVIREGSGCTESSKSDAGMFIVSIFIVLYLFAGIAIVCDELFVSALEQMAEWWDLSDDVAGATLMAAGGSAPELATSFVGTFQGSTVGIGTIVGSAVFNVLFVIGCCAICPAAAP